MMKMKNEQQNAFSKKLLTLVMPIAFQQFMLALVSASDALMLGMLTQDALSAVSLAGQITLDTRVKCRNIKTICTRRRNSELVKFQPGFETLTQRSQFVILFM